MIGLDYTVTANAIEDMFFSVCLFFLLTITGRNENIIVELKELFVLNGTFITFSGGFHHKISVFSPGFVQKVSAFWKILFCG